MSVSCWEEGGSPKTSALAVHPALALGRGARGPEWAVGAGSGPRGSRLGPSSGQGVDLGSFSLTKLEALFAEDIKGCVSSRDQSS